MRDHETVNPILRAQLARLTGCNVETVRYYEKIGLLPPPDRSPAGYRLYGPEHVRRLRFVMRARELGFPVDEVRGLLGLEDGRPQSCAEVKTRTEKHLRDVRARIRDLERIRRVLEQTAQKCSGADIPHCPVLEALSNDQMQ